MISEKVQVLVELLKQGDGAKAAATDLKAVEAAMGKTTAEATKAAAQLRQIHEQMTRTSSASTALGQAMTRIQVPRLMPAVQELRQVESEAAKVANTTQRAAGSSTALKTALTGLFAGVSAKFVITELGQAAMSIERMNNTFRAVNGADAGREFGFVRREAERLGLELESTVSAYVKLNAAAKGTALEGEGVREIFLGVAEAGTALGLSAAQQEGALQAVQQMMSKGTVQAEELRGQLGERLPGAFNIAARAMGVTTQELGKMLEQGQVISADFLPKFASELRRSFGPEAQQNSRSLTAEINRMRTAFFDLKATVGTDNAGIFRGVVVGSREALELLRDQKEVVESLVVTLGTMAAAFATIRMVGPVAVGSLGAALTAAASPALSLATAIGGVLAALHAIIEAIRMINAQGMVSATRDNLIATMQLHETKLKQQINLQERTGAITPENANAMREKLAEGFKASVTTRINPSPGALIPAGGILHTEPDLEARERALKEVRRMLDPDVFKATPPEVASGKAVKALSREEEIKTVEQLRVLQERMFIESLTGLDQENARINAQFEARAKQIEQAHRKLNLGSEELAQLRDLNLAVRDTDRAELALREKQKVEAEERRKKQEMARQASEEMQRLEQTLTTQAINSSETRIQQAEREFAARIALIDQLFADGKIDAERWNELSTQANAQRLQAVAVIAEQGRLEAETLKAITEGKDVEALAIKRSFDERRQALEAYYALEKDKARANALEIEVIEGRKVDALRQLTFQQELALNRVAQGMLNVARTAENQFASGVARGLMQVATSTKSADEAWREFAQNFLLMISEMILQTLVLIAVRMALKSIPGIGAFLGSGGQASTGGSAGSGSVAHLAAVGGIFDRHVRQPAIMAAGGLALQAAAGVPGVSEVDEATYLPNFNVIAGEAGREVLTVMAKPELIEVNGHKVIVGSVQSKRVAMMSAEDLQGMWRNNLTQPMALGGMAGSMFAGMGTASAPVNGAQVSQRTANGNVEIVVALGPELKAEIVRAAVEGAVVRVTQELQQDGRLSAAARRLTR